MIKRKKRNIKIINIKKIFRYSFPVMLTVLIAFIIKQSIPNMFNIIKNTAIISAALSLPEGGAHIISNGKEIRNSLKNNNIETENINNQDENTETNIDSDTPIETIQSKDISTPPQGSGIIERKTLKAGTTPNFLELSKNSYLKNLTKLPIENIKKVMNSTPSFILKNTPDPQVLIISTHATESYQPTTEKWYDPAYNSRSRDNSQNVTLVAETISKEIEKKNIGVIVDKTQHDYPSYNGSYNRSENTIKKYLKQYPSIKVVLDIHRDAIENSEKKIRTAPIANIDGKNAAQIMLISGADDGKMGYPNYMENLKFSINLQNQISKDYPNLARPMSFSYKKYNQHLTTGSVLIEMGGHGNSLEEALYAGELVGKSVANLLKTLIK
ncbi:MAG: stage II sporulation protein P [Oscillospiraceae bacterium]|nr:stage II sporulation protein P [Oscillospiraceae bacterium]